jgi:hypothetical protein
MERHSSNTCTELTVEESTEMKPSETKTQSNISYKGLKIKTTKKVKWTEDTIDNEHMGKKKSKSIYKINS